MSKDPILKGSKDQILNTDFLDLNDVGQIQEFDLRRVRGSVRLRTGKFLTAEDVKKRKEILKKIKFPK